MALAATGKVASLAEAVQTLKDEEQRLQTLKDEEQRLQTADAELKTFAISTGPLSTGQAQQLLASWRNLVPKGAEIKAQEASLEQLRKKIEELALREKSQIIAECERLVREPTKYDDTDMEDSNRQRLCDLVNLAEHLARLEESIISNVTTSLPTSPTVQEHLQEQVSDNEPLRKKPRIVSTGASTSFVTPVATPVQPPAQVCVCDCV